jgi:hypothetical protein
MFTEEDYKKLHDLTFRDDYSGYKPTVIESPNGDGKFDAKKQYAHVMLKYFTTAQQRIDLLPYLQKAHRLATEIARAIKMPAELQPQLEASALRILEYPVGAFSNEHVDANLFTLMLYRDQPDRFCSKVMGNTTLNYVRHYNLQAHIGQLGTEVGLGEATPHWVLPSETVQHSIVYFALPSHDSRMPSGLLVREWLNERMPRMRSDFKAYE